MKRKLSIGSFLALIALALAIIPACSGAPDYCDQCKDSAYACEHSNGKVTCHASEDSAELSCGSETGHHIGKCN